MYASDEEQAQTAWELVKKETRGRLCSAVGAYQVKTMMAPGQLMRVFRLYRFSKRSGPAGASGFSLPAQNMRVLFSVRAGTRWSCRPTLLRMPAWMQAWCRRTGSCGD